MAAGCRVKASNRERKRRRDLSWTLLHMAALEWENRSGSATNLVVLCKCTRDGRPVDETSCNASILRGSDKALLQHNRDRWFSITLRTGLVSPNSGGARSGSVRVTVCRSCPPAETSP